MESPGAAFGLPTGGSGGTRGGVPAWASLGTLPTVMSAGWAGPSREVGASAPAASSGTTPRTLSPPTADTPRVRRRALWRGEAGLPDRSVLVDWFPASQLGSEGAAAARVRGSHHAHLLSLIAIGAADSRSAYAISEASEGVDMATVARAAPGELPPWWSVQVIQSLCRAVLYLVEAQRRRRLRALGHGRIHVSNIFIGWNGRVQLLAFAPTAGSSRNDETLAPELRLSERLLSPAADVYALATLLRQLLPAATLARPSCARLLRQALQRQSEQRLSLGALHSGLQALAFELAAPLSRVAAIGEVVARFCPPARVDLLETDWGESTGDGLAALPPSLAPFATAPVSLSPTWYRRPTPAAPSRSSPSRAFQVGALGLCAVALTGLWGWGSRSTEVTTGLRPAAPSSSGRSEPAAGPGHRPQVDPSGVQWGPAAGLHPPTEFAGLRVAVSAPLLDSGHLATGAPIRVGLRLSNPGHHMIQADLRHLVLHGPGGILLRPVPVASGIGMPVVTVGPARQVSLALSFAPEVGDTAAASDEVGPKIEPSHPAPAASVQPER